jgi:hypothetical protein
MRDYIEQLILKKEHNYFVFNVGHEDPVMGLKISTQAVPNSAGVYLVFAENRQSNLEHLNFQIDGKDYELVYFGKAGGITASGKLLKQGLKGRINNVVSGDLKRGIYWDNEMSNLGCERFLILYDQLDAPKETENMMYRFLDERKIEYPILNKTLGRPKS